MKYNRIRDIKSKRLQGKTGCQCLKVTLHIPALVKYAGNDNALALDGENQHMLFDDQAFLAFLYVVPAVADFRVFP